jgi:predicted 3-demethylubiquinone-9 3-methyltransferase (glyoxalase superfamily)
MQKITPFLWFDHQAEEAVNFYISIFKNSKILAVTQYSKLGPGPEGSVMTIQFQLEGQEFFALNGGPHFKLTEAISLVVNCDTQAELDTLWAKLSEGGEEAECGWLQDKYGLSWQLWPSMLSELFTTQTDPAKLERIQAAVFQMKKLDIATLQKAAES